MKFLYPVMALVMGMSLWSGATAQSRHTTPSPHAIDVEVGLAMRATGAQGLALAVIDNGRVTYVKTYGERNAAGDPLEPDTVMYGASLTKAVFAYTVMKMADEGLIDVDRPIADMLPKPLSEYTDPSVEERYARFSDLAGDDRWRLLTPRMLLTHSSGFANFGFMEPDGKLKIHFQPGSRYSYSGAGILLLQFAIEQRLGVDIGEEMQRRVFGPLGMTRTSMMWRSDFAGNLADGWDITGKAEPHDERSSPRAAGSMDTTIDDFSKFAAAFSVGGGLSNASWQLMTTPQLPITTASQFPTLQPELPQAQRRPDLAASLGLLVFDGPQGQAYTRSGHNDFTGNTWVCVKAARRCIVLLSNDVRAEAAFPHLVGFVLGDVGAPFSFTMSDVTFWQGPDGPAR